MRQELILEANRLAKANDLAGAWKIVDAELEQDPDDMHALILTCFLLEREHKPGLAYVAGQRAAQLHPNEPSVWTNLGRAADMLWRGEEAKACFRKAMARPDSPRSKALVLVNLSAVLVQEGKFAEARKYAEQALQAEPGNFKALHNLGMCQLAAGEWETGWKNYSASVGQTANRPQWKYANEAPWKGETDGTVVVFGEQGIGDEISAASMFPDAIKRAQRVVLECDARLEGLYKRSFPEAAVYGTRNKLEVAWSAQDADPDYSISSMQLGELFRQRPEDCPGTPYLVPDPDRVAMWKGLWATKNKSVIGIAWTGGTKNTAAHARRWRLEELLPVFDRDAHFVCLQYTDCQAEVDAFVREHKVDLKCYPFATLSKDFDDTAALVASLDCVVSMQQTALHVGGALGVKTLAGIPSVPQWRYGEKGDAMPWYRSVKLFRQKEGEDWKRVIREIAKAC